MLPYNLRQSLEWKIVKTTVWVLKISIDAVNFLEVKKMLNLPGFTAREILHESNNSIVYRGYDNKSDVASANLRDRPVILKMLKEPYPSPEILGWFKREYQVIRDLNLPGVIKAYSLEKSEERPVMVLEDFGGDSLELLKLKGKLELDKFLKLAINTTEILGQIHGKNIIHKDINPSNIIVNPKTGRVKIIDFGISTVLSTENSSFSNPNVLEGTLAYISPEQTGRMNRAIDYRSDFYSLGVTFYELLAGKLPFNTEDALELIHSHLAREPEPLAEIKERKIPPIVSEIVQKLMAKNAEERYQSSRGIKTDLERCLAALKTTGKIEKFPLGEGDISEKFQIPQKLYGRDEEIKTLLTAFEKVSQGQREFLLIGGYSGVGKSALVREIHKPITAKRGNFISGKFDQYQRDIPYYAIAKAFNQFCRLLLSESEKVFKEWQKKIQTASGNNGQILIDVISNLELIIGPQSPVAKVEGKEAQNRFNLVFENSIKAICQPEHPLVLFIDDLQWADVASLNLLKTIMTVENLQEASLLIIGAYRNNEVNAGHPLRMTLAEIEKEGAEFERITLGNLNQKDVNSLIAETLKLPVNSTQPLTNLVYKKTQGNAFFTTDFLKSLDKEKLIRFDPQQRQWQWEVTEIESKNITDNVVELMAAKIAKLDGATQKVLQLAACIGNSFDLSTLAVIYEKKPEATLKDLLAAMGEGLVVPLSEKYKLVEAGVEQEEKIEFKFLHDRVQQAAYALIEETEKKLKHLQIGRLLLENKEGKKLEKNIFDLVNQLNEGRSLIEDENELLELVKLNLQAGKKAKSATAYDSAALYLKIGREILPADSWNKKYELSLNLYVKSTEAAFLRGNFEEMTELTETVFSRSKTLLDKIKVYEVNILARISQNKEQEAVKIALEVLELLGVNFPKNPTPEDIAEELKQTQLAWMPKQPLDLIDLPEMSDPYKISALSILNSAASAAYQVAPQIFPLIVLRQVYLSVKYGNTSLSCNAYSFYGIILCGMVGEIELGFQFGQLALMLSNRENARKVRGKALYIVNVCIAFWKVHARETLKPLLDSYKMSVEFGDIEYAGNALDIHSHHSYFVGKELGELASEMGNQAKILTRLQHSPAFNFHETYRQAVLNLIGKAENPCILVGEAYTEKMRHLVLTGSKKVAIYQIYFNQGILSFIFDNLEEALQSLTLAEKYLEFAHGLLAVPIFHFYHSLTLLAVHSKSSQPEQQQILEKVASHQEKMKKWADSAPMNFLHKYYLVEAEKHRILGENALAREEYDQAIELAKENEYINEEAIANELAGKFYLAKDKTKIARVYLQEARYCYQKWGAKAKVAHLDKTYAELLEETYMKTQSFTTTINNGKDLLKSLDLETVLKAYQAISGEIVLDKLLNSLMKIIIENAGARVGYLILISEENNWQIAASITTSSAEVKLAETPAAETLSRAIVNYVIRSGETVVLNNASQEGNFTRDPYILQQKPQSVLCAPLINRGKLIGVIYLENKLTAGTFTPEKLEVLNLLSSQAAISLENATLYSQLEQKVEERTSQLAEATKKAQAASEAKSAFLANMSHELRSPLNAILGFSQLTSRAANLPSEHRDNLGIISRSGEHLLTLINQVLDLSKIEAGRITLNEKNFDLHRLLGDIEDMFSLKAEDKGLHLLLEVEENLPRYICSDEVKVRQILINLLNNALKFTASGGVSVRVKAPNGNLKEGELTAIAFEVEDTGAGISPEELEGIFEAFVQSSTGKQAQEGTGLGLAISRKFVQLMGGEMTVSSEVGVGTIFKFEIKAKVVTASDIETYKPSRRIVALEPNQPRWRILVADDRADNRQLLIKLLNPLGFELKEASNGLEAIAIWEKWEPHLIWMDMRMPVMNGYEAAKYIKSTTKGEATAIIALTASAFEEERSLVLSAGCDDFVRKPFREEVLFEKMAELMGVRYLYEDSVESQLPQEGISQSDLESTLGQMPREWTVSLYNATVEGDVGVLAEAIALIPPSLSPLAATLSSWANQFQFEKIIELTELVIDNC
jgi:predicted ATPase/signal transduction histidine kinase/CheY-like chemotaxis protein/tRNA A-37 threonylcarbamoyl transferase component Bud32